MTAQDGVLDLVQRWAAAEATNDAATLEGLLDGGFTGVGPFGFILTRDQWLARFTNGLVNRSFTVSDLQVRDYGTTAVGIGVLAQETSWQGSDNSGRFRVTLVAVQADGEQADGEQADGEQADGEQADGGQADGGQAGEAWRLAHVHIGPLQAPPGRPS